MSQALALKYRPKRFEDLIGQDSISQTLAMALDQNRLGHAYLFSGLRGSGKTSTARIFSKALLCENGPTSKPCDSCEQCVMANEGRHIDIIEMDAASSRKIDDIRDLIEHTKYKPSIGRYKVFIIDEVHMLTKEAFNALLKTLEEPPEFVKFILATTDPLKLPATILSRTQHFRFKKIAKPLIIKHLEHILNSENIPFEPEALDILARSGSGSLRDTLTLLDQAIVYSKSHVDVVTVTQMLGIIDPEFLEKLFDAVLKRDEESIRGYLKELENYEAEMVIDEMSLFLKEKLFSADRRFSPMLLERFYRILAESKPLLALGTDGDFVLSLTLFKMVEALNIKQIDEMIEALESELGSAVAKRVPPKESRPNVGPRTVQPQPAAAPEPSQPRPAEAAPAETAPAAPKEYAPDNAIRFRKLIEKLYDRNAELGRAFEESIEFVNFENGVLSWASHAEGENKELLKTHFGIVRHFVQEIFGFETKISLVKSENPPPKPKAPEREPEREEARPDDANAQSNTSSMIEEVECNSGGCVTGNCSEEPPSKEFDAKEIQNDPMVKKAVELFGAKKITIRSKV
ncbi:DNA polymerase III subunits gamma and tau [Hydrogenimonas sp.]|nr:DNA polymerase III subunits gamma and tau [Hydrogenimonas sp.]